MRSVGPGASVVGVEGDFGGRHGAVMFADGEMLTITERVRSFPLR
jgi:hypothetical protein